MSTPDTEADTEHYEELCRAMQPGLLLTINESDPTSTSYDEMEVISVDKDSARVTLQGSSDSHYRIHHNGPSEETRIEKVDDEGYGGRSHVVATIEVVGVA